MSKKKIKIDKTNVIRILEKEKRNFETIRYDFNENEIDALSVAKKIEAKPEMVFKTLVANGNKTGINVFVVPGPFELDLKKAAAVSSNKKIELIKVKDLSPITGYIRGGCSPIGMKKSYPTYIDESARLFEWIYISAGIRGMQVKILPSDLLNLVNAKFVDII